MEDAKYTKLIDLISSQLELKNEVSKKFIREALDNIVRFDEKHTEKGFGNYNKYGPLGVVIKTDELINFLASHYQNAYPELEKDKVKKNWDDISIFAIMGKLIESGKWEN